MSERFPVCPLCRGVLIDISIDSGNELVYSHGSVAGVIAGFRRMEATCVNRCHITVDATKTGDPAKRSSYEIPLEHQAMSYGALKAGW